MKTEVPLGQQTLLLRDIEPADREAVLLLHRQVFGGNADAAWFDWKYGQLPTQGRGQGVGAWLEGQLIAFCAGLPRQIFHAGRAVAGLQIGDVMVHPQWRGLFTRKGPFFHVSKALYDSRLGVAGERDFQWGYGFPSARHLKLAELLGLLHGNGTVTEMHWPLVGAPASPALPWTWNWREIRATDDSFDLTVNRAWAAMQQNSGQMVVGARDANYVRWRFVDRPDMTCRFFVLKRVWPTGDAGIAVLRRQGDSVYWLDWVGPMPWMPMATRACRQHARAEGASELVAWASQPVALAMQNTDTVQTALWAEIGVPTSSAAGPRGDAWASNQPWWFMGGDTDFL